MPNAIDQGKLVPDHDITNCLFPCFSKRFLPCHTTSDGNCLWHMISICLCGDQSLTDILRCFTLFALVKYKDSIVDRISKKEIDRKREIYYSELLNDSIKDKAWGCGYHLLCLSTVLNMNIFIYGESLKNGTFLLDGYNTTAGRLEESFKSSRYQDTTHSGFHMRYEPISNGFFECDAVRANLYGFYRNFHYSALFPIDTSIIFVPRHNFINI
jgi:hypothetical protein